MKVYVSGRVKHGQTLVKDTLKTVEELGHTVTYDWTDVDIPKPFKNYPEVTRPIAEKMKTACLEADVFILIWEESLVGALIELGMALGASAPEKQKVIYILGAKEREVIFEVLPEVRVVDDLEGLTKDICKLS